MCVFVCVMCSIISINRHQVETLLTVFFVENSHEIRSRFLFYVFCFWSRQRNLLKIIVKCKINRNYKQIAVRHFRQALKLMTDSSDSNDSSDPSEPFRQVRRRQLSVTATRFN